MSEDVTFHCGQCGGLIEARPDPLIEDRCPGGKWVCVDCGAVTGIWLDAGTLDLGLVRESVDANPSNDFEVFA